MLTWIRTPQIKPEGIPRELQQIDRWVMWRFEERDGKLAKVPQGPEMGWGPANVNLPECQMPFRMAEVRRGLMGNSMGIVMSPSDRLVILDLDDCIVDGMLKRAAMRIVDRFRGCYAEVSVSGTGLHLAMWGPTEPKRKFVVDGITVERFSSTGYVCMTGDTWKNGFTGTLQDRTADLAWLERTAEACKAKQAFVRSNAGHPALPSQGVASSGGMNPVRLTATSPYAVTAADIAIANSREWRSDGEVISCARKHSPKKIAQYQRGDITGYKSLSELEQGAAEIIAYWSFGNRQQTERLLRYLAPPERRKLFVRPSYARGTVDKGVDMAITKLKEHHYWDPVAFLNRRRKPVPPPGYCFTDSWLLF